MVAIFRLWLNFIIVAYILIKNELSTDLNSRYSTEHAYGAVFVRKTSLVCC